MRLRVITPDGAALETEAKAHSIPTEDGCIGVLEHHAPMICAVAEGKLRYVDSGDSTVYKSVGCGVAHIGNNEVVVLVDRALDIG